MIKFNKIISDIKDEYISAVKKYPDFPSDIIHQVSIMNEEAGESIRAVLNHIYHGESIIHLQKELLHTAAMCIRCLLNIGGKNEISAIKN